ncbi:hypothetical protein EV422DRAFT_535020 [Fimicolochytrium jonesii]|nr:hypothetical protein EV422DRAFT_535020 [Fimicolochytrium jonesii]
MLGTSPSPDAGRPSLISAWRRFALFLLAECPLRRPQPDHLVSFAAYLEHVEKTLGTAGLYSKHFLHWWSDFCMERSKRDLLPHRRYPDALKTRFTLLQTAHLQALERGGPTANLEARYVHEQQQAAIRKLLNRDPIPISPDDEERPGTPCEGNVERVSAVKEIRGLGLEEREVAASPGRTPDTEPASTEETSNEVEDEGFPEEVEQRSELPAWTAALNAARVNAPKCRERLLWKKIVDLDSPTERASLGGVKEDVEKAYASALKGYAEERWHQLSTAAAACLARVRQIDTHALAIVGRGVLDEGRKGMMRTLWETSDQKHSRFSKRQKTASGEIAARGVPVGWSEEFISDKDALYIIQMLGKFVHVIDSGLPAGPLSERDGDAHVFVDLFAGAAAEGIRTHYGEVESRSSRRRRSVEGKPACGAKCDYLFTSDDIGTDEGWGTEWSVAANVGMRRDARSKNVKDKAGLVTLLRDIHCRLANQMPRDFGERDTLIHRMHVSGMILQNWTAVHVVVAYVGGGYYACKEMARAQLPTKLDANFGSLFARSLRCFLQFRDGVSWTRDLYLEAITAATDQDTASADSQEALPHETFLFPRTPRGEKS